MDPGLPPSFVVRRSTSTGHISSKYNSSPALSASAVSVLKPSLFGSSTNVDLQEKRSHRVRVMSSESVACIGYRSVHITDKPNYSLVGQDGSTRFLLSSSFVGGFTPSNFNSLPDLLHAIRSENLHRSNTNLSPKSCLASLDAPFLTDPHHNIHASSTADKSHCSEMTDALSLTIGDNDEFHSSRGQSSCSLPCPLVLPYFVESSPEFHCISGDRKLPGALEDDADSFVAQQACTLADESDTGSLDADSPDRNYQPYIESLALDSDDDLLPGARRRRSGSSDGSAGFSTESECNEFLHLDRSYSTGDSSVYADGEYTHEVTRHEEACSTRDTICISELSCEAPVNQEIAEEAEVTEDKAALDADEDILNPAYVPRTGAYFMHDYRVSESPENTESTTVNKSRADCNKWPHDLFRYHDQGPRSEREIIRRYGRDIRRDDPDTIEGRDAPVRSFPNNPACDRESLAMNISATAGRKRDIPTGTPVTGHPTSLGFNSHTRPGRFTRSSVGRRVQADALTVRDFDSRATDTRFSYNRPRSPAHKTSTAPTQRLLTMGFGSHPTTDFSDRQQTPHETIHTAQQSLRLPIHPKDDLLDHKRRQENILNQRHSKLDPKKEVNQCGSFPKRYSTLRQQSMVPAISEVRDSKRSSFCDQNDSIFLGQNIGSTAHGNLLNNPADSRQTRNTYEDRTLNHPMHSLSINPDYPSENLRRGVARSNLVHTDSRRFFFSPVPEKPFQTTGPNSNVSLLQQPVDAYNEQSLTNDRDKNEPPRFAGDNHSRRRAHVSNSLRSHDNDFNRNTFSRFPENQPRRGFTSGCRAASGRKPFATQEIRGARGQPTRTILVE